MSIEITPRERLKAAFARAEVDRPPVMPAIIRWIRGRYGCTSELQQLKMCEEFGFDPLIMYGMYLNNPVANDCVYRPDGPDVYRDLPDVNVDARTENYPDRTVHIRRFETPAGVLTDRIVWARAGIDTRPPYLNARADHIHPMTEALVKSLVEESMPVKVMGNVQHLINRRAGSWVVTLINNRGVYKEPAEKEIIRPQEKAAVDIYLARGAKAAREWISDQNLTVLKRGQGSLIRLVVPAGGVKIVELDDA